MSVIDPNKLRGNAKLWQRGMMYPMFSVALIGIILMVYGWPYVKVSSQQINYFTILLFPLSMACAGMMFHTRRRLRRLLNDPLVCKNCGYPRINGKNCTEYGDPTQFPKTHSR